MAERPSTSPWGKIQSCKTIYPGVFGVSTEGHGGIMVKADTAYEILSPAALKCGRRERGYICFEEDCDASVVIREMLDKNIWKIPAHFKGDADKYNEIINASLIQWNPEYWEARGNILPLEVLEIRLAERFQQNFTDYCEAVMGRKGEPGFLDYLKDSTEIAAMNNSFSYLKREHKYELPEVQYLLKFTNPLMVIADYWQRLSETAAPAEIMREIFDKQDALRSGKYALISGTRDNEAASADDKPEKSSLLAQVKENQEIVKNQGGSQTAKKDAVELLE